MSAIVSPALSCASRVLAPRCGVTTTRSSARTAATTVVGSASNTSSAAPAIDAVAHRVGQRRLVDDAAAGDVDHAQRRLRLEQQVAADQARRLRRLRQVDREEVGLGDDLVERQQLDAHLAAALGGHERVEGDEAHPEPVARSATSLPMRPRPTMPSVLSASSTPSHLLRSQRPATSAAWAWGTLRAWASSRAIVCSAAETMLLCGALTTITPRRVAASTSTLSRPMPARPTTIRSEPGGEHLGGDLRRRADDQGVRADGWRRAGRPPTTRRGRRPRGRRRAGGRARPRRSLR